MASQSFESELIRAARDYQQNHYELCSDWNSFDRYELEYLRDYIGYGLFGPPLEKDDNARDENKANANGSDCQSKRFAYNEKQCEVINMLYDKVIEYSNFKENKHNVLCSIVYNVIFNEKQALQVYQKRRAELTMVEAKNLNAPEKKVDQEKTECSEAELQCFPVPVLKVKWRNGIETGKKDTAAGTVDKIYFIDNGGRVYNGFSNYLKNNTLPTCTMVLPKGGVYRMDPKSYKGEDRSVSKVWLEILPSPANSVTKKVLLGGDITSTIITTAGMAVGITAMFTPIGPAVAIASAVGTGVSGLWTAGRSAQQLADRGLHGESINVTDRAALGAWIGIAGSTLGVAATGGTALFSRAIRTGTSIGRVATVTHDAVQIGNLIVNGIGISYKSYDIYATWTETNEVSAQDVFFFAAHLLFFCNAVVNVRLAHNLIESSQAQVLKDYEADLRSNRHRREFQRMARNTRAAGTNDVSSNEEIIRSINKINNKDEFFQSMVRNRKAFSASGAKASFADGKVSVNSRLTIDPIELSNLPKDARADIIRGVSSTSSGNSVATGMSNSPGINPINVAGAKVKNVASTKPQVSTGSKPKTSNAVEPNESTATKPKDTRGVKPNNVAATESNNAAASESNEPITAKVKNVPNETSYKNYDTSNGTILREFCMKHSSAMMRTSPPRIADFQNVLCDLRALPNCAIIFCKLLEMAYRIYEALPRNEDVVLGKVFGLIVDYLWDVIKTYMSKLKPGYLVDDPTMAPVLDALMTKLSTQIAETADSWVAGFKQWLEDRFPRKYRFSTKETA